MRNFEPYDSLVTKLDYLIDRAKFYDEYKAALPVLEDLLRLAKQDLKSVNRMKVMWEEKMEKQHED